MSILLFVIAVIFYTISQLQQHNKLKWMDEKKPFGFWGEKSDHRKYKTDGEYILVRNEPNWYYKLIRSKYKERWFTSTWLTVLFTDGYHLAQAAFKVFLCAAIATHEQHFTWWFQALIYWILFSLTFTICYRVFSKKVT